MSDFEIREIIWAPKDQNNMISECRWAPWSFSQEVGASPNPEYSGTCVLTGQPLILSEPREKFGV